MLSERARRSRIPPIQRTRPKAIPIPVCGLTSHPTGPGAEPGLNEGNEAAQNLTSRGQGDRANPQGQPI